jgi:hypothetical protein
LAKEINDAAVRGVKSSDIAATRLTLLAIIANLAEDEMRLVGKERRAASSADPVRVASGGRQLRAPAHADMSPKRSALHDILL